MPGTVDVTALAIRLEKVSGQIDAHIESCEKANVIAAAALARVADKMETFEKLPMQAVRWLGALIIAGAALTNVLTYINNQEAAQKATQAASAAAVTQQATTKLTTKVDKVSSALGIPTNTAQ